MTSKIDRVADALVPSPLSFGVLTPEGRQIVSDRAAQLARRFASGLLDTAAAQAREIAGNFATAARTNNQEYQNAMQGWRYADPPPGVKVVELDGATYWQTPDGRYTEPQRINIAGLLPMGQNEQTGAVSLETGRLLPLTQGYMSSELGTSLSAPKGALGAGAGRVSDKADDAIRAYHGSPHDFDKFDMSKIGTGEGAQSYGRGLYFAESEGVAKQYKRALSLKKLADDLGGAIPKGAGYGYDELYVSDLPDLISSGKITAKQKELLEAISNSSFNPDTKLDDALKKAYTAASNNAFKERYKISDDIVNAVNKNGHMYAVNLNLKSSPVLDLDTPISRQPESVRNAAAPLVKKIQSFIDDHPKRFKPGMRAEDYTGGQLQQIIADFEDFAAGGFDRVAPVRPEAAANDFLGAGIKAVKYLDQGSRAAGEGSRNYVVFDDSLIEILRKYGLIGLLGGAGAGYGASEAQAKPGLLP